MDGLRVEWMSLPQNSGILGGSRPMIDNYVRERVRDLVRRENEKISAEIGKIDAELRKGYPCWTRSGASSTATISRSSGVRAGE